VTERLNQYKNGDEGVLPTRLDDQDHAGPECGEVALVALESGDSGFVGDRDGIKSLARARAAPSAERELPSRF
jgi:hypothetical protein